MKRNARHNRRPKRRGKIPRRVWVWTVVWLVLAIVAIACSHRFLPGAPPLQQRAERVARPAEATAARTEEKITTRSDGKAVARPTDGGSVSSKNERKVLPGGLELPAVRRSDTLIYNEVGRYTFLYRPSCKVSQWVAYKLTRSDVVGGADRSDAFREDPRLARFGWPSATNADYKGSGYDRGHLLPSADRKSSVEANRATFLYSNMAPQLPKLNRGAWKVLEERLRRLTADYDTLYVVVGTVVDRSPKSIGDGVAVPRLFFKAVALRRGDDFRGEAYVMPNSAGELAGKSYDRFEVTVDSVERLTGLDLFPRIAGF